MDHLHIAATGLEVFSQRGGEIKNHTHFGLKRAPPYLTSVLDLV